MDFPRLRVRYNRLYACAELNDRKLTPEQVLDYNLRVAAWRAEMAEIEYVLKFYADTSWRTWQIILVSAAIVLSAAAIIIGIWNL